MNTIRMIAFGFALTLCGGALAKSPVPRPAPPLTVTDPAGNAITPASYRGDVVLVQFLYTTCKHCAQTAKLYQKLQQDLGPRGFKVVGVAFNDGVTTKPELIKNFSEQNGVTFPIGAATSPTVLQYLGLTVMTRLVVPQVVVIDRNGTVRAQSEALGSPELQDEQHLRGLLEGLLKEKRN
jgi:peroxiredoxin